MILWHCFQFLSMKLPDLGMIKADIQCLKWKCIFFLGKSPFILLADTLPL